MEIKVKKRDQSLENFEPEKVSRVAAAAGLNKEKAEAVSQNVARWIKDLNQSVVDSSQIRDKVIEELKQKDGFAANLYTWYEKTKQKA
ncbi:MAG: ATP cone domain-containing protein [Patescibacteria group bacterium]|nr:ATP cone domain-containing protein [Patescibacteria group bacterium]